jgi:hypothetical protein
MSVHLDTSKARWCNELQAIGDPVLKFFEQYDFLSQQLILLTLQDARLGEVLHDIGRSQ